MRIISGIGIAILMTFMVPCSSSEPTAADKMRARAEVKSELADMWDEGSEKVEEGNEMIEEAEEKKEKALEMKEKAEKLLEEAELMFEKGKKMVIEGTSLKNQSETEYKMKYPDKKLD